MNISYHGIDLHANNFFEHKINIDKSTGEIIRSKQKYIIDELEKKFIPTLTKNSYV